MKHAILTIICTLALVNCAARPTPQRSYRRLPQTVTAPRHSQIDLRGLGNRIWKNECAGSVAGLVSWNDGEAFPSLGIGHFIWYPAGYTGPFDESFP